MRYWKIGVIDMVDRKLLEQVATDTAKMIRREIRETYGNEELRGLNGFLLTKSELDIDTVGLEKEIEDIMKHPRNYKAMIIVFAYFRNMMIKE